MTHQKIVDLLNFCLFLFHTKFLDKINQSIFKIFLLLPNEKIDVLL